MPPPTTPLTRTPNPAASSDGASVAAPRRLARTAGLLYLSMGVLGVGAHLVVRADVYVAGDAAATTANVVAHVELFRWALVADIGMVASFALLGVALYRLLADVDRRAATAMLVFVAVGAGMILTNLGFHHAALLVATDHEVAGAFGPEAAEGLTLLLLDLHDHGYRLAGVFFGLWLLPLGLLVRRSRAFPRFLGIALVAGGVSWIVDTLVRFAVPELPEVVHAVLKAPTFAEFWLLGYLLVRGVRSAPTAAPLEGPAATHRP